MALEAAVDLAQLGGGRLHIVSAYEPLAEHRSESIDVPQDVQWTVGPRADVLQAARAGAAHGRAGRS